MVAHIVKLVITGIIKNSSGTVKSLNQNNPPVLILSTGTFAISRSPMKNDIKIGICKCVLKRVDSLENSEVVKDRSILKMIAITF